MSKTNKLTKSQMQLISEVAATEAIKAFEKKQAKVKKEIKDRNLRNTGLLLKNYIKLKDLCRGLDEQEASYENTIFDLDNLTLETLGKYQLKTLKMLNHVDKMLVAYEWNCCHGTVEEERRFKILKNRYLMENRLTVKEITENYDIDQSTVYRDTKAAIKDISIMLFGTNGCVLTSHDGSDHLPWHSNR